LESPNRDRIFDSLLVGIIGIYLSITHWHDKTALSDSAVYKNYLLFVYIEFFVAALGAFILIKYKLKNYIAPWISFIVGVHFFWLKGIFKDPSLYVLAILLVVISITSLIVSKKLNVANSAITGIGTGAILLGFAIVGLIRFLMA
jgi:hypothetical protein